MSGQFPPSTSAFHSSRPANPSSHPCPNSGRRESLFRKLLATLYTHNPFYLISAGLVLFGAQACLTNPGPLESLQPWISIGSLTVYSMALVTTGILLVRRGGVWEDARTIFLVVPLLFAAIASLTDGLWLEQPTLAAITVIAGLVFSTSICELTFRSLKLVLPPLFRLSVYFAIAILFLAPFAYEARSCFFPSVHVGVVTFLVPTAFAVLLLGLCYAAPIAKRATRRVSRLNQSNSASRWRWPAYPWSLFLAFGLAVIGRTFLLALAFESAPGIQCSIDGYFLVPIAVAIGVLLIEYNFRRRHSEIPYQVLLFAPLMLLFQEGWNSASAAREFSDTLSLFGSPIWIPVLGLIVIYAYGVGRRVEGAEFFLTLTVLFSSMIAIDTRSWWDAHPQNPLPLFALAGLQFGLPRERVSTARWLAAAMFFTGGLSLVGVQLQQPVVAYGAWFVGPCLAIWFLGLCRNDRLAFEMRTICAFIAPFVFSATLIWFAWAKPEIVNLLVVLLLALAATGFLGARRKPKKLHVVSACFSMLAILQTWVLFPERGGFPVSSPWILSAIGGGYSFVFALAISCRKAGMGSQLRRQWLRVLVQIRHARKQYHIQSTDGSFH